MDQKIGQYRVVGEIGRGGMGVVLRAVDTLIGRTVALKVIRFDQVSSDPAEKAALRERLFREAQSAGILSHPNIVTVYQVGEEGETAFIAMEYVDGSTLEKLCAQGMLGRDRVADTLRQAAAALDYAHRKGIFHRDIKPANIMIDAEGVVKICDFGIAKISTAQTMTETGMTLGTPHYMSPEQIGGGRLDGRSDQFALAVVAYQMLSGARPFEAESIPVLFYRILQGDPRPIEETNPSVGAQAGGVFRKALAKQPEGRYESCSGFAEALRSALAFAPALETPQPTKRLETAGGPVAQPSGPAPTIPLRFDSPKVGPLPAPGPAQDRAVSPSEAPTVRREEPAQPPLPKTIATGTRPRRLRAILLVTASGTVLLGVAVLYLAPSRHAIERRPAVTTPSAVRLTPNVAQPPVNVPTPGASRPATEGLQPLPERDAVSSAGPGAVHEVTPVPQAPGGSAAPWPTFRGSLRRAGVASSRGPRDPAIRWQVELHGQLRGSPVVGSGNRVYIGSTDRNLYAVLNGQLLWAAAAKGPLEGTPFIDRGQIRTRLDSGAAFCVTLSGGAADCPVSESVLPEETAQSPDGRLYYSQGSTLRQVGDSRWSIDLGGAASTSPAVDGNGTVYVGTSQGALVAIDESGKTRWTYRAALKITTPPALKRDGDAIFGCADRNLYCVRGGELRWKFPTRGPIYSAPIVDSAGTVYFGSSDGFLYAVDETGEQVWKLSLQNEICSSPAIDLEGRLYVATVGRWLYCVADKTQSY
jgi:serine/threonine protein kinase/outer membrane protein assembly factor BamB